MSGHAQVQETEALYKMCISDANFRRQELEKVRARIVSHIRKLIYQGDEVLTWVCVVFNFSSNPRFRESAVWHKTSRLFTVSLSSLQLAILKQVKLEECSRHCFATNDSQIYKPVFNYRCFEDRDVHKKILGGEISSNKKQ